MAKKHKPVSLSWGDKKIETKAQNAMKSPENPYSHLSSEEKESESNEYKIMLRGNNNLAPQDDIQLGLRSITHKRIAQQLARLVAGNGIDFYVKNPENEDSLTIDENLQLEYAEDFRKIGLDDTIKVVANGIVYQNLSSIVTTNKAPRVLKGVDIAVPEIIFMTAYPSERLRFSNYVMNDFGQEVVEYHYYHKDWGYDPDKVQDKPKIPEIIPIEDYIILSQLGELEGQAYAVFTSDSQQAKMKPYVSFPFLLGDGIFDNAYPMPEWKSNSSINDIQSEFESSCIRIDYLRNGMHIFAIVNVYSVQFNTTSDNDFNTVDEDWAKDLEIVKGLKGSFNSGRIIVNPLGTNDPNLDGKIEIESIKLDFPVEQSEFFNQEARAGILTAWGVMADLFSISKPEKNNLRSQGEYLKIGILLLQQQVGIYQSAVESGYNKILDFYGLNKIGAKMRKSKNSVYFAVMVEIAKEVLTKDELRSFIFDLTALTEDQRSELLNSNNNSIAATTAV